MAGVVVTRADMFPPGTPVRAYARWQAVISGEPKEAPSGEATVDSGGTLRISVPLPATQYLLWALVNGSECRLNVTSDPASPSVEGLAAETAAREAADTTEATARASAVSGAIAASEPLGTVSTEKARAEAAEAGRATTAALSATNSALTGEVTAREAAEAGKATVTALIAEASARAAGDVAAVLSAGEAQSAQSLFSSTAIQTVAATTTETSIVGAGTGSLTIPPNFLRAGRSLRFKVRGLYSTPLTLFGELTVKIKVGSTVLATGTAKSLLALATNAGFEAELIVTCQSAGASGKVMVMGGLVYYKGELATAGNVALNNGSTLIAVDTTVAQTFGATVTWSNATAGNSVSSMVATLEALS